MSKKQKAGLAAPPSAAETQGGVPAKSQVIHIETAWVGPLPEPGALQKYAEIDPSLPERIVRMAEEEGNHRRAMENKVLEGRLILARRGQLFALIVALAALFVAAWAILQHEGVAAAVIGGASLATVVAAFLRGGKGSPEASSSPRKAQQEEVP